MSQSVTTRHPNVAVLIFSDMTYRGVPQPLRLRIILKCLPVEPTLPVPGTTPHIAPAVFEQRQHLVWHQPFAHHVFHNGALLGKNVSCEQRQGKKQLF